MRPAQRSARARRAIAALPTVAALVLVSACGAVGNAQQVVSRARLVNDLANRLSHAGSLTYTAIYRLPGGQSATIVQAQTPARAVYLYADGKLLITPDYVGDCRTSGGHTTCTLTPPETPSVDPTTALLAQIDSRGLIAPTMVVGLLTAAALDNETMVTQHDTTIAGENATCVDVTGINNAPASSFSACITIDGLLGSFTGTVGGSALDVTLDRYTTTADPGAFNLPAGAQLVDNRPK
jgi:hypothetical protein